jgi:hypothetical protein
VTPDQSRKTTCETLISTGKNLEFVVHAHHLRNSRKLKIRRRQSRLAKAKTRTYLQIIKANRA